LKHGIQDFFMLEKGELQEVHEEEVTHDSQMMQQEDRDSHKIVSKECNKDSEETHHVEEKKKFERAGFA
jgi:hypothetical protein